jgi:hypothetical protein
MDTIGQVMGQAQPAPGFPDDYDPLWYFDFDIGLPTARNLVDGGFNLVDQGDMMVGNESYSPALTRCRQVPVNSTTARMLGANTPQWWPAATLDAYTFQAWINFDAEAHPSSWGVNPNIFKCVDISGLDGVEFMLQGAVGPPHEWTVRVAHHGGGSSYRTFSGFVFDSPNPGWKLVTVTFNLSLSPSQRLKLYIDDSTAYLADTFMDRSPGRPSAGAPIYVADFDLWGQFDAMRMLDVSLTQAEVETSYEAATTWPDPVDFAWVMQIIINGEVYGERVVRPDERRRWTDFKAPVRHLNGQAEVAFRLTLQEI